MEHEVIERTAGTAVHPQPRSRPRRRPACLRARAARSPSLAALGGRNALRRDLRGDRRDDHAPRPDARRRHGQLRCRGPTTSAQRLQQRGWTFVGNGEWQDERVLGVSFAGDRRANRTADELARCADRDRRRDGDRRNPHSGEPAQRRRSPPTPQAGANGKAPELARAPGPFSCRLARRQRLRRALPRRRRSAAKQAARSRCRRC